MDVVVDTVLFVRDELEESFDDKEVGVEEETAAIEILSLRISTLSTLT